MNRIIIDLEALRHNLNTINRWTSEHPAECVVVTKSLCGHADSLRALHSFGVHAMGDSRLDNLRVVRNKLTDIETWYLRVPGQSSVSRVVELAAVSLNSEIGIIEALNREAQRRNRVHRIIIMIELGDLREGILPGSLVKFYQHVFELSHIEVSGIGANLGCLSGTVPTVDQFMQLALYRELLELKFHKRLPLISAGSTVVLPLLRSGKLPRAINHFRIGEAIFLGSDLVNGGTLTGLRDDAVILEAEIVEIKEKGLIPLGETGSIPPFDMKTDVITVPGQRGYRALINVGQLDTDVSGLTPKDPHLQIAGASSDIAAVNLGPDPRGLTVGDVIPFRVNYAAMLRLMSTRYIPKQLIPPLEKALDPPVSHGPSGARRAVPPAPVSPSARARRTRRIAFETRRRKERGHGHHSE